MMLKKVVLKKIDYFFDMNDKGNKFHSFVNIQPDPATQRRCQRWYK